LTRIAWSHYVSYTPERLSEHVQAGVNSPAATFGISALLVEAMGLALDAIERLEEGEKEEIEIRG